MRERPNTGAEDSMGKRNPLASKRRRGRKRKVHSLIDKVFSRRNLELAWEKVKKNRGSAGMDEVTIAAFEKRKDYYLELLHRKLRDGTYRPKPVKRVEIPKSEGGVRKLGIPAVIDRVCQQALVQRMGPIFEATFVDCSFGYREGRSPHDAMRKVWRELLKGHCWIVDADLRKFLETSSHCTPIHEGLSKRPGWLSKTLIRKPFRFPRRTWTAGSSPRFTRCNTVCLETPRSLMASSIGT